MHILAIRFSSMGDVVLQTSFVSWLKMSYPNCKITFLTSNEFIDLLNQHPHIDEVISIPRFKGLKGIISLKNYIKDLQKKNNFDLLLDLHGTTRSYFVKMFLPFVKKVTIDKRRFERALFVKLGINLLKKTESIHSRHQIDFSNILAPSFKVNKLESFVNKSRLVSNSLKLTSSPLAFLNSELPIIDKYIVLSPVASFAPKRWAIQKFYELAKLILNDEQLQNFKVIVLAGPNDNFCEILNPLEKLYTNRFFNLQGKTSISQTMQYLKYAKLCIGNDTGLNHIAEACGNPVITIFGPTHEDLGFKAHLENSKNISIELNCRPCSTTGKKECKFKEQICMTNITEQQVYEKAKEILQGK